MTLAVARHATCRHAKACRRVVCLPTVVATGSEMADALLCDCCCEYERDDPREEAACTARHGESTS